ncbi:YeeE/YedE thiosulfate transporter family protein [Geoalkalibacter sp.]|uniref:YeeE/YedE thiosulfate transporter family protein n=1 Tax=Geoalkalibacter sp. TaxID=3041440 RepID=UPI00272E0730|nr:YeeE/YedE thiosulfate transporter family protein [Geoalkalibacter sp.]
MLYDNPWLWFFSYLGIGLLLGTVLYRSDFCMAGMLRDVFLFRDRTRLRHLFLAVVLTLFLFLLVREVGWQTFDSPAGFSRGSLLGVAGGVVFGIGMVLAGGCVFSTLYKMAGGNLAYVLVFCGIIAGSLLYAELFPWLQVLEQQLALAGPAGLNQLWPQAARAASWLLVAGALILFVTWQRQDQWQLPSASEGYVQPWLAAVFLAALNAAAYLLSGLPLGISTAYAKLGAFAENLLLPAHVAQLEYFNRSSLVVRAGESLLLGGAGPRLDMVAYTEGALLLGILLGAFFNALLLREFRIYGRPPLRQGGAAFAGGVMLALGARLANGCNIKHLLGGLPLLSFQSLLFFGGLLVGAWVGARLLPRIILR